MIRLRSALWILLAVLPRVGFAEDCLSYGKTGATLTGYLTRHKVESRSIGKDPVPITQTAWMLYTPTPFCVTAEKGSGDIAVEGGSIVEIWPSGASGSDSDLVPLIGRKVRVVGSLAPTYLPHYHAYLILQLHSIAQVEGAMSEP
jgi:hypothetical protein